MSKTNLIAYSVLLVIIVILTCLLIFRKPVEIITTQKEQIYKDSITLLQDLNKQSIERQEKLQTAYDSLSAIEPKVINITRDKIKYIYTDATIDELDTLIRTNWKTKSRYR